ncbi:MAG: hypothetical protein HN704_01490 [Bacteroidetes bacterium]|nr:hypothetical protein [Bacteroidota bacterium]MBT6687939.1 hypothetical protein [Bacteroidota bacterium]MBT7143278.1 hypothetical protein [Bacteroidota bacterium]MBT7490259.1 hypothetical protein [Bacteroidota bacterium]
MKIIYTSLFIIISQFIYAQDEVINPNGYNYFYYQNGKVSSEGNMRNGKPSGFWKTYYNTGELKSEGNRKNFLLDSVWNFYQKSGTISEIINYRYGKKNGYYFKNSINKNDSVNFGKLISKELYLNDIKQGLSYYYKNGKIHKLVNYKNGDKDGIAKEFNQDSVLIAVLNYRNDFLISKEKINRKDKDGLKQGAWKEFFSNDRLKSEANYLNDLLHGFYREFDRRGKLIINQRYNYGILIGDNIEEKEQIVVKEEFYENGKIKKSGGFIGKNPVGIHKEFEQNGTISAAILYDDLGNVKGTGMIDDNVKKQGEWKYFYPDGKIKSKGKFRSNKKNGKWEYYYLNGNKEQKGIYKNGKFSGDWIWYFENGKVKREEHYYNGKEEGQFIEYDELDQIISKGEFIDGEKEGEWYYFVGDHIEKGKYKYGLKDGLWEYSFPNGDRSFEGSFIEDREHGKHRYYFKNGNIRKEGEYLFGKKEKRWRYYDSESNLIYTISYKKGIEYKINGKKIVDE